MESIDQHWSNFGTGSIPIDFDNPRSWGSTKEDAIPALKRCFLPTPPINGQMDDRKDRQQSQTSRLLVERDGIPASKITPLQALTELLDLRLLVIEGLLHPVEAVRAYIPHLDVFGLFGGKVFTPETDIPDLAGKVILVTGGNTGLGLESIRQLAAHNPARIYLAARTPSKAEAAISGIKNAFPSADIVYLPLDLCSFDSIFKAAKTFTSQSQRLDLLMNNAGVMALPPGTMKEGFETQLGTNHVGPTLLTKLLMPILLSTAKEPGADVRIINLASEAHNFARNNDVLLDNSKLNARSTWVRYGYSKLANILFTQELAARYPSITSVAIHPGVIKSDLWMQNEHTNFVMKYVMAAGLLLVGQSVKMGARNQLWAATCEKEDIVSGGYYKPIGILSRGNSLARNPKLAKELWERTEKELESKGC